MARGREREDMEGPEVTEPGTPQTMGVREAAQPGRGGPTIKLLWSRSCRLRPRAGAEHGSVIFWFCQITAVILSSLEILQFKNNQRYKKFIFQDPKKVKRKKPNVITIQDEIIFSSH